LDSLASLDQNFANANTIEEVCMVLVDQNMNQLRTSINNIEEALDTLNIDAETRNGIIQCLNNVFGTSL
jgi:prefoldin subunit 5